LENGFKVLQHALLLRSSNGLWATHTFRHAEVHLDHVQRLLRHKGNTSRIDNPFTLITQADFTK